MSNNQGGRQEGPAQSDKDTGRAQPGTHKDAGKMGQKGHQPGQQSGRDADDDSDKDKADQADKPEKGGQQGGKIRQ